LKIHEEDDLSFLYKNKYFHGKPLTFSQFKGLKESFDKLKQTHLEAFGLGKRGEHLVELKLEVVKAASNYLVDPNPLNAQMTKIYLEKVKQEEGRVIGQSLQDEVNAVEDVLNRSLNLRKLTIKEYRSKATFAERKISASNNG
jgi:hypothetical protein